MYELQFLSPWSKMFQIERMIFPFIFKLYGSDSTEFYQCTLPQVTYYVASGSLFYL